MKLGSVQEKDLDTQTQVGSLALPLPCRVTLAKALLTSLRSQCPVA